MLYPTTGADTNQPQERRPGERFATIPSRREVKPMQKTKTRELWIFNIRVIKTKTDEKVKNEDNKKTVLCSSTVTVKSSKG